MSNLIKAGNIHIAGDDKKIIDSDNRVGFQKLSFARIEELPEEAAGQDYFQETVEPALEEEDDATAERTAEILNAAREQAEQILAEAVSEAEQIREDAHRIGRQEGYEAGIQAASEELKQKEQELFRQGQSLENDYERRLQQLEPEFAGILISYLEKLTGILIQNKQEVILHLLSTAIRKTERSHSFVIRACAEDCEFLENSSGRIEEMIGSDADITVMTDNSMMKNQCIIETDNRIIDCGLDTQLKGLTEDIRFLSLR